MSAHKKKGVASSGQSRIVTSDGGRSHGRTRLHAKLAGIALLLLAVLGGVSFGFVAVFDHHKTDSSSTAKTKTETEEPVTPAEKAQRLATLGSNDQAQKLLDQQVAAAKTKQAKADLYAQQATVAINANEYTQANGYALKAEQTLPSSGSAYMLANIAELRNDTPSAVKYLQQAISRLDKNLPQYQLTLRSYQNELQGLQS